MQELIVPVQHCVLRHQDQSAPTKAMRLLGASQMPSSAVQAAG